MCWPTCFSLLWSTAINVLYFCFLIRPPPPALCYSTWPPSLPSELSYSSWLTRIIFKKGRCHCHSNARTVRKIVKSPLGHASTRTLPTSLRQPCPVLHKSSPINAYGGHFSGNKAAGPWIWPLTTDKCKGWEWKDPNSTHPLLLWPAPRQLYPFIEVAWPNDLEINNLISIEVRSPTWWYTGKHFPANSNFAVEVANCFWNLKGNASLHRLGMETTKSHVSQLVWKLYFKYQFSNIDHETYWDRNIVIYKK